MKKHWLIGGLAGVLALSGLAFIRVQDAQVPADTESPEVLSSGQPIAFPHDQHAGSEPGQNNMDCMFCHYSAERSVDAGIPPVSVCAGCHQVIPGANNPEEVAKVMQYWNDREPIPWVRIYKISDHAHFPHMRHIAAGHECQECHGEVQTMGVLEKQRTGVEALLFGQDPVWGGDNMGWCVDCHRQEEASIDCSVCHY